MEFSDLWSQAGSCLTIREKNRLPMDRDLLTTPSGNASGPGLKERPRLELIRPEKRKDNRENKEKTQEDNKSRETGKESNREEIKRKGIETSKDLSEN